ncbi:MAG: hypothetical protein ACJAUV_001729 [Flavobacteriales bacterium]|jgi:hypothetical protein
MRDVNSNPENEPDEIDDINFEIDSPIVKGDMDIPDIK